MVEYPRVGSLLESLMLIIQYRRQKARFLETLLITNAAQGGDTSKLRELASELQDVLFPYISSARETELEDAKELLSWFMKQGPIQFTVPKVKR